MFIWSFHTICNVSQASPIASLLVELGRLRLELQISTTRGYRLSIVTHLFSRLGLLETTGDLGRRYMGSSRVVRVSAAALQTTLRPRLLGEVGRVIGFSRVGEDVELCPSAVVFCLQLEEKPTLLFLVLV